ncbi:MAG TPA: ATP-binding protein [Myxococcaceae bacterium]|nr:ATP-binding protein [Myxococcaceae bacterium]
MAHAPSPKPSASLARSTLINMGVRIAVIIALATLFSYLHIFHSMRAQALAQLERHVSDRSQREQEIFLLAQDNHVALKQALRERIEAWRQKDPQPHFDTLFARMPDGTIRNQFQGFDGTRLPQVFVARDVPVDDDFRRRLIAAYEVTAQYGPPLHVRFTDTYVMLPEGALVMYWPKAPNWSRDVEATYSFVTVDYFTNSLVQNNPRRETTWTGVYEDAPSKVWLSSSTTPLDIDGRHVASVGSDVLLDELMSRTLSNHLPGSYNILFRDDGQLIAHPDMEMKSGAAIYNILSPPRQEGDARQQAHLRGIFDQVKARTPGQSVLELPKHGEYLAVARLEGPGWNLVTVMPEAVVSSAAFAASRYVLLFGLVSLLLELAIMYWVLKQQITRPLLTFTQAAAQLAAGDFKVTLKASRDDELGRLSAAFQHMAQELQQREEALRQANEGLEQRVEERTRELKEVHRQLVHSARQAGMAEIATNVLHNVGNVLNSVQTAAVLAKERVTGLKLEQVGRVANLLEQHRENLGHFLTQTDRGRKTMPFLSQLSQNLVNERKGLLVLLEDVNRYTAHISSVVKLQQNYARLPRLHEPVLMEELVQDALRINAAGLGRHHVQVEQHLNAVPPVHTDKNKVLMILVNIISNAKYALDASPQEERRLTVRLEPPVGDRLRVEVRDTGVGIAPEMLTRIFQYGFTTREEGHGFGLHSSALAAQELGGSLTAYSEGLGRGATFVLELPYRAPTGTS